MGSKKTDPETISSTAGEFYPRATRERADRRGTETQIRRIVNAAFENLALERRVKLLTDAGINPFEGIDSSKHYFDPEYAGEIIKDLMEGTEDA